jgi:hypothetical protein
MGSVKKFNRQSSFADIASSGGGAISKSAVATAEEHSNEPFLVLTGTYLTEREPNTSANDDCAVKRLRRQDQ